MNFDRVLDLQIEFGAGFPFLLSTNTTHPIISEGRIWSFLQGSPTLNIGCEDRHRGNLKLNDIYYRPVSWSIYFATIHWYIWKWRCKKNIYDQFELPCNPKFRFLTFIDTGVEEANSSAVRNPPRSNVLLGLSWNPSPHSTIKLEKI